MSLFKPTLPRFVLLRFILFFKSLEYFHRTFSLSTSARIRTQDPGQRVSPRWSATDHPWAPCFNEIEGSLVIWFDRGSHRFNTDQTSVPSLLRVPRVWNRGPPRQGSCNRMHPTLPVDVECVVSSLFYRVFFKYFPRNGE